MKQNVIVESTDDK